MPLTKAPIKRTGVIRFGDASLFVREDGVHSRVWAEQLRLEREFKRDVFARIVQTLRRLGWTVGPNTHIFTGNNNRYARKGDLRADLKMSGGRIEFDMFQNVNAPNRPDHGGRYEFDQESLMPYMMRLEMERTRRRIRDYLCNALDGYSFDDDQRGRRRKPLDVTALDALRMLYAESSHFKGDWDAYAERLGGSLNYNRKSANGAMLEHGQRVWFCDRKGRICEGTAYYNTGNMWWVVSGKYDYQNLADFELFTVSPSNLRIKRNGELRRSRLEREMSRAIEKMDFERAAKLRDITFPGSPELFLVWHMEHQAYHCTNFRGYTTDRSKAGKFTAHEARNWHDAPNVVVPAVSAERVAA
ncbi:UvrB/UvrC motif-containing protein [Paraburkholderia bannensis]|uniref:UvrB/UvrC motif-containing protein n=1 Tax=Paraburkholderia bannensis TaxID=765414 RepID=UPI0005A665F9|nr:UvrB/UvrC motif-containing protein [Paraburkholderia bannensis]